MYSFLLLLSAVHFCTPNMTSALAFTQQSTERTLIIYFCIMQFGVDCVCNLYIMEMLNSFFS